jgi:hypothetical protein
MSRHRLCARPPRIRHERRYPATGRVLLTDREKRDREGNADKCAGNAPKEAPEEYSEQHKERRNCESSTGKQWLKIAADQELNDAQSRQVDQCHLPRFELCGGEERCENHCYKWTQKRHVVQHKKYRAPGKRQLKPDKKGKAKCHKSRQNARKASD